MVRTQIQLTENQADGLKRLASQRGVSMAALIRSAVDRELSTDEIARRRRRALAVVGRYSSGLSDVSENHDRYLAEDFLD